MCRAEPTVFARMERNVQTGVENYYQISDMEGQSLLLSASSSLPSSVSILRF
jgi:predicted patatin/cPLA2 family phospholipase